MHELNQGGAQNDPSSSDNATASARYELAFYLLESLATVKSCILLVHLAMKESSYQVHLLDLFEGLFETIQPDMSTKVQAYMADIMVACIDEMEEISQPILSTILKRILPKYKVGVDEIKYDF